MTIETKPVETKVVETAGTPPEIVVAQETTEVDSETLLAQKDAEIAKIATERDNYRKGLLKAKGKIPAEEELDSSTPEGLDALIDRKVTERMLATKEAQLHAEKDDIIKKTLKRNKELELALKNRTGITSTSGQGSNQEKPEGKADNFFSNEQLASLKAKGYSDKKIEALKKNLQGAPSMPTSK